MVQLDISTLPMSSTVCLLEHGFVAQLILVYIFLVGEINLHISLKINVIGLQILPKAPQTPHFILHLLQQRRRERERSSYLSSFYRERD